MASEKAIAMERLLSLELEKRQRARETFHCFLNYIMPSYQRQWFHTLIADKCQALFDGTLGKKGLMLFVPPQHGKEISDSTLVPTPNGFMKHGELKAGDYVFGKDGKPVKVLAISEKVRSEYIVTFNDGKQIECHGNHEWVVFDRSYKTERTLETKYIATQKLYSGMYGKRGCHYRFQVNPLVCVEFSGKEVDIDPYTFGAWLGDGLYSSGLIHIGSGDTEIVDKIKKCYNIHENRGSKSVQRYRIEGLTKKLKALGVLYHKHIPNNYIFNSEECRKQLIAGLIDTDGSVYRKNGRVTISNTNKDIIDGAALILRSLGQNAVVTSYLPTTSSSGVEGKKVVYQLCFNPTTEFPTVVPRKKVTRTIANRRRAIVKIERVDGLEIGNCIQVEGGVYLVGDTFIPTHNSEIVSRKFPAWALGQNPKLKIVGCSYSAYLSQQFSRSIQRTIDEPSYRVLFPDTFLNTQNTASVSSQTYVRNIDIFETVGQGGFYRAVGVLGGLTGTTVDLGIIDDPIKDAMQAYSSTQRERVWEWYTDVFLTRLHNDSKKLLIMTRWHPDDLAGRLLATEADRWEVVNIPAIKEDNSNVNDPRKVGEALWEQKHSLEELLQMKDRNGVAFQALYQQNPVPSEGLMYSEFKTYTELPQLGEDKCYCDPADVGSDYHCAIFYREWRGYCYVTDVLYTKEDMDVTEPQMVQLIYQNGTAECAIEANGAGRLYAKNVERRCREAGIATTRFTVFAQTKNKQVRIYSNANAVNNVVLMPVGWERRWPKYYNAMTSFLKEGRNENDDAPDATTGVVERMSKSNKDLSGYFW